MTLVEVLVAIFLLAIVGTIVSGIIISAMKLTNRTQSGVEGQSELNDAVSRITRDVAAADPILYTSTATGWASNTPSATELWVQNVSNGKCVRTRYYVNTASGTKSLKADVRTYATSSCPDPRLPDTSGTLATKTLIGDLKTTNDSGVETKVFTYYDQSNTELTSPVNQPNVNRIARVRMDVGSNVRDRDKGVRLSTSVAPRSMDSPLTNSIPPPDCAEVNLRVASNGAQPSTPVVQWSAAQNADRFSLNRDNTVPAVGIFVTTQNPPAPWSDTAMRGRHGATIDYSLDVEGPGGTVQCTYSYLPPPAASLTPPVVSGTVTPDTSNAPQVFSQSQVNLSWAAVPNATSYTIYRRAINPNNSPYNAIGTGTWALLTTTTSTSYAQNPGFDQGFEYKVVATSTDFVPTVNSADSNAVKTLTHSNVNTMTGTPLTYGTNRLNWQADTGSTVDGYALWRRPTGTSAWTKVWETTNVSQLSYDDTTAALGSRYDYIVTSFNNGPRGTQYPGTQRYYGEPTNVAVVLQFPAIPITTARGTENNNFFNSDGRNSASWGSVPSATTYELWEMDTATGNATRTVTGLTGLSYSDASGNPRGSRNFYMAVACNPTGCSQNKVLASARAGASDDAYQRPNTSNPNGGAVPTLDSNTISFNFSTTGDTGEASDKFCGSGNLCYYSVTLNGAVQQTLYNVPSTTLTRAWGEASNNSVWGSTGVWGVNACNPGGCSGATTVTKNHYPGPFNINSASTTAEQDHYQWWENNGYNDHTRTGGDGPTASTSTNWGDSTGVRGNNAYYYQVSERANDNNNASVSTWRNQSESANDTLTPGAAYNLTVTAFAQNGLSRPVTSTVQVAPNTSGFIESTIACRENITDGTNGTYKGWKMAYRFKQNSAANRGSGRVGTFETNFRYSEVMGKMASPSHEAFASVAGAVEYSSSDNIGTQTQWKNLSNNQFYWKRGALGGNSNTMTNVRIMLTGNLSNDGWYIPSAQGNGALVTVRGQVDRSGNHNTTFGDWAGRSFGVFEYAKTGGMDCPGYSGWDYKTNSISRWALRGTSSAVNPNTAAGATFGTYSGNLG